MDIYRRIYRLANKNVPANQIAVTLGLPLKNVKSILHKLKTSKENPTALHIEKPVKTEVLEEEEYLDVYIMQQSRVTIVDLTGFATEKNRVKLKIELNRVEKSDAKIIALLMSNLKKMDQLCYKILLEFKEDFFNRGRYVAILDPSPFIETFILDNDVESQISVFGTVSALENKGSQIGSK